MNPIEPVHGIKGQCVSRAMAAALLLLSQTARAEVETLVWVLPGDPGQISVIDTSTNTVTTLVQTYNNRSAIAFKPDGSTGYVTGTPSFAYGNGNIGEVQILEIVSGSTTTNNVAIPSSNPQTGAVAVTPDNEFVYVANPDGPSGSNDRVAVIRTSDHAVTATIAVPADPIDFAVAPNGEFLYVTETNAVQIIRTSDNTIVATVPVAGARHLALTPDGAFAYITKWTSPSGAVLVMRTSDYAFAANIQLGDEPLDIAIAPNGASAYVVMPNLNSVTTIRTADNTIVATTAVGPTPRSIAITPDGAFAYVANRGLGTTGSVSVLDTASSTVVATIPVAGHPHYVAMNTSPYSVGVGDPVTVLVRGTITDVRNACFDYENHVDCAPVDSSLVPFHVGEEMRLVLTYDPTIRGRRDDRLSRNADGSYCHGWRFESAVQNVRAETGANRYTSPLAGISISPDCDGGYQAFDTAGQLNGPTVAGLPASWQLQLSFNGESCFDRVAPVLPSDGFDPPRCAVVPFNSIGLAHSSFDGDTFIGRNVEAFARNDVSIERITELATTGSDVFVAPQSTTRVRLKFENVSSPGTVNVTSLGPTDPDVPPLPSSFDLGGNAFLIETDAQFSGNVEICLPWSDASVQPSMLHYVNGAWTLLPVSISHPGAFCAMTDSLSPFAMAVPGASLRAVRTLITAIANLNLKKGLANSLDVKIAKANAALSDMKNNNDTSAAGSIHALMNEVNAQRGKGLTNAEADALLVHAQGVLDHL